SMGDDTQLTPFVARPRLFADHLRQRFAQVTNPPIDPYREGAVFDTTAYLGRLEGFFGGPIAGRSIALESPILSAETLAGVLAQSDVCGLSTVFPVADGADGAARALDELERAAAAAAPGGERLRRVLLAGVVKVMSKMGICAASSYVGSQLFEALGLEPEVVERCCPGVARWGSGVDFAALIDDVIGFHQAAWAARPSLAEQGFVRFRKGGVPRAFEPRVFSGLPKVVAETVEEMECYAAHEQAPPEEFVPAFLRALDPAARRRYAGWAAAIN